jgi:beta-phosphoglucomutase
LATDTSLNPEDSSRPPGVIWDVDGTLVDTAELHFQSWLALTRQLGKPLSRAEFEATFGQRNPEIIPRFFGQGYSDQEIARLGERKEELYRAEARKGVSLLPGVRSLLEGLREAGFKQAIGSSAPLKNLELILDITQTRPFFQAIVSMEDTDRGKPDPQVFLLAAQRLGIRPKRCLVMEDAVAGVQAAKSGGMKCIAVRFVGHHPRSRLEAAGADCIVDSLEEVSVATARQILAGT